MNISPFIVQLLGGYWYLIPIAVISAFLRSSQFKGVVGEFIVNFSARLLLDKKTYRLIKNVTLPTDDGSTQIDHIIASVFGVFVVETKNMKGWIFGNPSQRLWTQKVYKHSSKFQNPLHQNYKHVKTLESLLGLNERQVHSVIVFVGDSTFKTEMPENVTYGGGYAKYIKSKLTPVLTTAQVIEVVNMIEQGRLSPSFKTNSEHVKHVKNITAEEGKGRTLYCPKCGALMILREARKGQKVGKKFWGCSTFPICQGSANVE